ncbi:hypothetical protein DFH07DRAFT_1058671 [Mycena maculata]|uniref:Zn(2)-C6 fungal-type domain-containing protein n=1 Tax=Mycena maculata TaxID=230809 RepID=A0AAD7NLK5_9AGAR|nr:hypothetical protein DFH07DRAFT_1058671 [Mycena maculata]
MANPNQPRQIQPHPAPFALMRRRTIIACSNCRKRKARCITTEQPPKNPCARCVKRGVVCEYVSGAEPEYSSPESHNSGTRSDSNFGAAETGRASPAPRARTPGPSLSSSRAPPLPYTGPPPLHARPRYAGSPLPDLSLEFSNVGPSQAYPHLQYAPAQYVDPGMTDPRYYTPQQNRAAYTQGPHQGYDLQADPARQYLAAHAYSSQSSSMPSNLATGEQLVADYTQFIAQYNWTPQRGFNDPSYHDSQDSQ